MTCTSNAAHAHTRSTHPPGVSSSCNTSVCTGRVTSSQTAGFIQWTKVYVCTLTVHSILNPCSIEREREPLFYIRTYYVRTDIRSYVCMYRHTYILMYIPTYVRMYISTQTIVSHRKMSQIRHHTNQSRVNRFRISDSLLAATHPRTHKQHC